MGGNGIIVKELLLARDFTRFVQNAYAGHIKKYLIHSVMCCYKQMCTHLINV